MVQKVNINERVFFSEYDGSYVTYTIYDVGVGKPSPLPPTPT